MIVLKFHEFEDYHFFLKFFLISFNRFLIFPVFRITKVIVKMKKEYQVTESELFDFFNGKLSVEEEKEILEWKSSTSPSVALLKRPPQSFIAFLLMRGQVNRPREKIRFKSIVPCFPARVKSRACIFCALIATLNAVSLTFS